MRFQLTCFDFFNDGRVDTSFMVEAPSQEVGEYLIKKQLSKLFRAFPAGQLIFAPVQQNIPQTGLLSGGMLMGGQIWTNPPVYTPNVGPGWVPNIVVGDTVPISTTTGGMPSQWQGGNILGGEGHNSNLNGMFTVEPGATQIFNGATLDGIQSTYTVTNSSASAIQFAAPQQ